VSGLGDVTAAVTYNVLDNPSTGLAVDLTGKIKFGTASADKALGTGKNDYSVQSDVSKEFRASSIYASVGYKVMGDTDAIDFKNYWFGSLGAEYKIRPGSQIGLTLDLFGASVRGAPQARDLSLYFTQRFSKTAKINVYLLKGQANGSADWGGGLSYTHTF
jgi:hypothetical protein